MTRRKRAEEAEGAQGAEGEKITNYQLPIPHTPHPIPYNLFITPHTPHPFFTDN
ncbi:MAG: hypothetical protein CLLPBCKN_002475 [Chroococcidiopsis cubana SAG 39.79]|uniref:hypothetical protein n=1 Tax=Chroococcidiopsis cubana TaxID=171392 RepID=UPI001315604B|nr:hypothetical protein [Chroococcidiopsis cubana]MDZ4873079.1 hypothetical protein [Chroococcidiopsis cubana SAG 39.79]